MSSFMGIGTSLYGVADRKTDPTYGQTYVTTKWFCIANMPVIPLRSLRIGGVKSSTLFLVVYMSSSTKYYVLEQVPLNWPQIAKSFLLYWGILAAVVALGLLLYTQH